ncbi:MULTISPECIES: ABC transporter permease [unclassified Schlesneria]|uniref:ABC transporter permease n=1 Tax=Schlesneria TaxID=656899 RepID=UPI002EFF74DD
MFAAYLFAAAPWQVFGNSSPVMKGIFAGAGILLLLLLVIGKVPLSYNLMNLKTRWLTTLFMVGAFTLVIGIQIVLLAFVNGMYSMTESSGQPGNVLIMSEGSTDEAFSNLGFADATEIETQEGVARDEEGRSLVSRETYLGISQQITDAKTGQEKRRFLQVRGVDDPAMSAKVHGLKLMPGGDWFSEAGVREINDKGDTAIEAMLGAGIARELGNDRTEEMRQQAKNKDRLEAGDTFQIGDRVWYVTGIFASSGTVYDSEVWTRQSQVGPLFGKSNYTTFCVRADPNYRKDQRQKLIEDRKLAAQKAYDEAAALYATDKTAPKPKLKKVQEQYSEAQWGAELLKEYFANEYKQATISPQVEQTYFANLSATNVQFLGMAMVVALIMSMGGLFGVMNTMFAAISQRTKDIGVLRLLGFRRWQILVSFLLESLVLALIGGAIGCAIGSLCDGFTANSIVTGGPGGGGKFVVLRLTVDPSTIAVGMLLALAMGFFGGLIPSVNAMRLSALKALR